LLSSLTIRAKLLVTVAFPLVAVVGLAAVAYPTFETVKVNGPQYGKIRAAKDLEADILPPPGFSVEAFLDAGLLVDAPTLQRRNQLISEIKRLHKEFTRSHRLWQTELPEGDIIRTAMADASKRGEQLFTTMQTLLIAPSEQFFDADPVATAAARELAKANYTKVLLPIYESHKVAVDESVRLALIRQDSLESETRSLVSQRLLIMLIATLSAFGLIALVASTIARSIRRPIKALTDAARYTADHELPETVARIQAGAPADTENIRSAFADNTDEIGELARAFDSMHTSSVKLAAEQARIRRNVADNLINIGRRSQGLLKRNLSHLTKMENEERDAAKLDQLFRLDHLTTRMRRNAESILVLAGSESPKVWAQPMPVEDMVRSALGQIEAYDRVDLGHLEFARLRGNAIGDLSHLLAELLENATQFSPPKSRVTVFGKQRLDGYLLVISDDGVGMTAAEFDRVNTVLSNPAEFDTEATKVLGHIVVGRLALRHGVRVRVTESATTGVAAQIMIPRSLIEDDMPVEAGPWSDAEERGGSGSGSPSGSRADGDSPIGPGVSQITTSQITTSESKVSAPSAEVALTANSAAGLLGAGSAATGVAVADVAAVASSPNLGVAERSSSLPTRQVSQPASPSAPERSLTGLVEATPAGATSLATSAVSTSTGSTSTGSMSTGSTSTGSTSTGSTSAGSMVLGAAAPTSMDSSAVTSGSLPSRAKPAPLRDAAAAQPLGGSPELAPRLSPPQELASARVAGSLAQRVRGAQLPVTGYVAPVEAQPRDAGSVRSALSSLQRGMDAGKSVSVPGVSPSPALGSSDDLSSATALSGAPQKELS
jgi:signal transduction histidine kinase